MVVDYTHGITGENPCGVKIVDGILTAGNSVVEEVTFCNFPRITSVDLNFQNCVFENCAQISINCGHVEKCRFHQVDTFYLEQTNINACTFRHIYCDDHCLISLENGTIRGCTFRDVRLENQAVLCDATNGACASYCKFEDIQMDREDKLLFRHIASEGKIFKRKRESNILHEETCVGLEKIIVMSTEMGSFR